MYGSSGVGIRSCLLAWAHRRSAQLGSLVSVLMFHCRWREVRCRWYLLQHRGYVAPDPLPSPGTQTIMCQRLPVRCLRLCPQCASPPPPHTHTLSLSAAGVGLSVDGGKTFKAFDAKLTTGARYGAFPTVRTWPLPTCSRVLCSQAPLLTALALFIGVTLPLQPPPSTRLPPPSLPHSPTWRSHGSACCAWIV